MPATKDNPQFLTYYGEYTLKNWVRLILLQEIELPEFQRGLVWGQADGLNLMERLLTGDFVPPVVIANLKNGRGQLQQNLVLDGQQRLSSIVLFYLGFWPQNAKILEDLPVLDDEDLDGQATIYSWTFRDLQEKYKNCVSLDNLLEDLRDDPQYLPIKDLPKINRAPIPGQSELRKYYDNNFMGFSFIKQARADSASARQAYSRIFRSINISGTPLAQSESRAALAWLKSDRVCFLAPDFARKIQVNNLPMDWTRMLAFVSESAVLSAQADCMPENNAFKVAKGKGKKLEQYYEEFILAMTDDGPNDKFFPFSETMLAAIPVFEQTCQKLMAAGAIPNAFKNIIEADICLAGLAFWIIFHGKNIDQAKIPDLRPSLEKLISKNSNRQALKTPNRLAFLRPRIAASIQLYQDFMS